MQIIPAIDLLDTRAVRLFQGRYDQVTVYAEDPTELVRPWHESTELLHVVDLEGARAGRPVQGETVRRLIAAFAPGRVQIGGGVRSLETVAGYFALGVERVVLGTAAVLDPKLVRAAATAFPDRIVLAVDAKDGRVKTSGWLEESERDAADLVDEFRALPLAAVLYTDIERDGTERGPNLEKTRELAASSPFPVIASGGVGTMDHVAALASLHPNVAAAIVGRALLERRFTLTEAVACALKREPAERSSEQR